MFHPQKEGERKEGKNRSRLYSEEPSGCSDPAGLKERQKATLSHSDKWTSSIDCQGYCGGRGVHKGCSFWSTLGSDSACLVHEAGPSHQPPVLSCSVFHEPPWDGGGSRAPEGTRLWAVSRRAEVVLLLENYTHSVHGDMSLAQQIQNIRLLGDEASTETTSPGVTSCRCCGSSRLWSSGLIWGPRML